MNDRARPASLQPAHAGSGMDRVVPVARGARWRRWALHVSALVALTFTELAFLVAKSFASFCVVISVALVAMFATSGPSYALSMWAVPPAVRPLSQVGSMHACRATDQAWMG